MGVLYNALLPMSTVKSVQFIDNVSLSGRYLGVEILTDEFQSDGIIYKDEGLLLKTPYARINPGDLICVLLSGQVLIHRYDPIYHQNLEIIGKITRTWRDYR